MRLLHVAEADQWAVAVATGRYEVSSRGRTLADEGFIHASTGRQVLGVLTRFYADLDPGQLRLLVLDADALQASGSAVRWDPVAEAAELFPHIYGPIVLPAVVAVLELTGPPGAAELPDLTDWDVADWDVAD